LQARLPSNVETRRLPDEVEAMPSVVALWIALIRMIPAPAACCDGRSRLSNIATRIGFTAAPSDKRL
jgi:hypothetical protein